MGSLGPRATLETLSCLTRPVSSWNNLGISFPATGHHGDSFTPNPFQHTAQNHRKPFSKAFLIFREILSKSFSYCQNIHKTNTLFGNSKNPKPFDKKTIQIRLRGHFLQTEIFWSTESSPWSGMPIPIGRPNQTLGSQLGAQSAYRNSLVYRNLGKNGIPK